VGLRPRGAIDTEFRDTLTWFHLSCSNSSMAGFRPPSRRATRAHRRQPCRRCQYNDVDLTREQPWAKEVRWLSLRLLLFC